MTQDKPSECYDSLFVHRWEEGINELIVILCGFLIGYVLSKYPQTWSALSDHVECRTVECSGAGTVPWIVKIVWFLMVLNLGRVIHGLVVIRYDPYYYIKVKPKPCGYVGLHNFLTVVSTTTVLILPFCGFEIMLNYQTSKMEDKAIWLLIGFALIVAPYVVWDILDFLKFRRRYGFWHTLGVSLGKKGWPENDLGHYAAFYRVWFCSDLAILVVLVLLGAGYYMGMEEVPLSSYRWRSIVYGSISIVSIIYLLFHYGFNFSFYFRTDVRLKALCPDPGKNGGGS